MRRVEQEPEEALPAVAGRGEHLRYVAIVHSAGPAQDPPGVGQHLLDRPHRQQHHVVEGEQRHHDQHRDDDPAQHAEDPGLDGRPVHQLVPPRRAARRSAGRPRAARSRPTASTSACAAARADVEAGGEELVDPDADHLGAGAAAGQQVDVVELVERHDEAQHAQQRDHRRRAAAAGCAGTSGSAPRRRPARPPPARRHRLEPGEQEQEREREVAPRLERDHGQQRERDVDSQPKTTSCTRAG